MATLLVDSSQRDATEQLAAFRHYFVARIAGLPTRVVDHLRAPRAMRLIALFADVDGAVAAQRNDVTQLLFKSIGLVTDKRSRNRLLQLRRDLFNGRRLRDADVALAKEQLDLETFAAVQSLDGLLARRVALLSEAEHVYREESCATRARFRAALGDDDFRRGLLVSSPTLYRNLRKYLAASAEELGAREEQIERGLLRYFTRTAMKATPFGTLCAVVPGRLERVRGETPRCPPARYVGDPGRKRGFIRLNKNLYRSLWTHLKSRPVVRAALTVEFNPTMTIDGGVMRFLTAVGGREVFQQVAMSDTVARLLPILQRASGARVRDLLSVLLEDPEIDATEAEAVAYVDQLIEIGLLRVRSGIREQDVDWDVALSGLLEPIDDDHAQRVRRLLILLRAQTEEYALATVESRDRIGGLIRDRLAAETASLGLRGYMRTDLPFYEDATADAELRIELSDAVDAALARLAELLNLMLPLARPRIEQATLRHFFDQQYGDMPSGVPLLRFFEDYYRAHYKQHLEKEALARAKGPQALGDYDLKNPFNLAFIQHVEDARKAFGNLIRHRWAAARDAIEITLTRADVAGIVGLVDRLSPRHRSVNVICQLEAPSRPEERAGARLHVFSGTCFAGYGKFFSRFLYMFPSAFTAELYDDNNASGEEWLAEICADGDFNGNLHPPLLGWEISYPTAEGGRGDGQLLISELDVLPAVDDPHELRLVHRVTRKVVVPFDLGFLNSRSRPPLFQLLSLFSSVVANSIQIPEAIHVDPSAAGSENARTGETSGVEYRPRVTYEDVIVLARRRWLIRFPAFPRRAPAESDAMYFLRANQWREALGIPERVYLRVHPISRASESRSSVGARAARAETEAHECDGRDADDDATHPATAAPAPTRRGTNHERPLAAEGAHAEGERRTTAADGRQTRRARYRDWRKPQFIDFGSPLLVKLFGQIPAALERFNITVEEQLPSPDGLPDAGAERFVTEMIVQADFPARSGEPRPTTR